MTSRFFHLFNEMIDRTPTDAVLVIADGERRMLEDDLARQRIARDEDTRSILSFCNFLHAAAGGQGVPETELLLDHFAFYRSTIERLVDAGELPDDARDRFDHTFSAPLLGGPDVSSLLSLAAKA